MKILIDNGHYNKIKKEANPVVRHIMVILVIFEMPEKWDEVVRKYLADLGKSSYYFGDTLSSLKIMFAKGIMSDANLAKTCNLILLAYTKMISKEGKLLPERIKTINKSVLPDRLTPDINE